MKNKQKVELFSPTSFSIFYIIYILSSGWNISVCHFLFEQNRANSAWREEAGLSHYRATPQLTVHWKRVNANVRIMSCEDLSHF